MPALMSTVVHPDTFNADQPTLVGTHGLAPRPWTDADVTTVCAAFQGRGALCIAGLPTQTKSSALETTKTVALS